MHGAEWVPMASLGSSNSEPNMSALGQKRTYSVHKPMSAKCQLRTSLLFLHKPFCRARGALRIAAIAVDQHQGHGAFG